MSPAAEGGIDGNSGQENFTENRRHQSLTSMNQIMSMKTAQKKRRNLQIKTQINGGFGKEERDHERGGKGMII